MGRTIAALVLAAAFIAAGCKSKELPAGKMTPEVRALLAQVPGDSKLVAGIDLALARSSGLWDQALADVVPTLIAVGHQCGTHLITEIDRVVVSSPDNQPAVKRLHFVVAGRFSASGKSCLNEIAALREANASWVGGVAVVSPGSLVPAAAKVTANPEMMARIEKTDTGGVVWLAADTRGAASPTARVPIPAELHAVAVSLRPQGDGVAAVARLEVDTEERAKATADLFREQKESFKKALPDPKLGDIIGRIEVTQQGAELGFEVAVNKAELDHLLGMKAMLGGGAPR